MTTAFWERVTVGFSKLVQLVFEGIIELVLGFCSLHLRVLSRPASCDNLGNSLFYRWQWRKGTVRLLLVPVSDGKNVVRPEVRMAILDGYFDGFMKSDGRFHVPAVHRKS